MPFVLKITPLIKPKKRSKKLIPNTLVDLISSNKEYFTWNEIKIQFVNNSLGWKKLKERKKENEGRRKERKKQTKGMINLLLP
jgi:hypothetical protein